MCERECMEYIQGEEKEGGGGYCHFEDLCNITVVFCGFFERVASKITLVLDHRTIKLQETFNFLRLMLNFSGNGNVYTPAVV